MRSSRSNGSTSSRRARRDAHDARLPTARPHRSRSASSTWTAPSTRRSTRSQSGAPTHGLCVASGTSSAIRAPACSSSAGTRIGPGSRSWIWPPTAVCSNPSPDGHAIAVTALRAKYPQYGAHRLEERPILRLGADTRRRALGGHGARGAAFAVGRQAKVPLKPPLQTRLDSDEARAAPAVRHPEVRFSDDPRCRAPAGTPRSGRADHDRLGCARDPLLCRHVAA